MELEAAVKLFAESTDNLCKRADRIVGAISSKPIHKPVGGAAVVVTGVNPTLVAVTLQPVAGRVWNILSAGIYGSDPHTPVGPPQATPSGGFSNGASAAAPAANAQIAPIVLPPGVWDIYITTLPNGTLAAADNSNLKLVNVTAGTTIEPVIPMDSTTANNATNSGPFQVQLSVQSTIAVEPIANASAGSIYTVSMTAVPVSQGLFTTNVVADFYAGQLPDPMTPSLTDVFDNARAVPSNDDYSKGVYWASPRDNIFAMVYNASVGQQLVMVVNVAEYPVEAVEAMSV